MKKKKRKKQKKGKQTWKKVDDLNGKKVHVCKAAEELLGDVLRNKKEAVVLGRANSVLLVGPIGMSLCRAVHWNADVGRDDAALPLRLARTRLGRLSWKATVATVCLLFSSSSPLFTFHGQFLRFLLRQLKQSRQNFRVQI